MLLKLPVWDHILRTADLVYGHYSILMNLKSIGSHKFPNDYSCPTPYVLKKFLQVLNSTYLKSIQNYFKTILGEYEERTIVIKMSHLNQSEICHGWELYEVPSFKLQAINYI